eukprot:7327819-Karenia_brevis.AAC.1
MPTVLLTAAKGCQRLGRAAPKTQLPQGLQRRLRFQAHTDHTCSARLRGQLSLALSLRRDTSEPKDGDESHQPTTQLGAAGVTRYADPASLPQHRLHLALHAVALAPLPQQTPRSEPRVRCWSVRAPRCHGLDKSRHPSCSIVRGPSKGSDIDRTPRYFPGLLLPLDRWPWALLSAGTWHLGLVFEVIRGGAVLQS